MFYKENNEHLKEKLKSIVIKNVQDMKHSVKLKLN